MLKCYGNQLEDIDIDAHENGGIRVTLRINMYYFMERDVSH